MIRTYSVEFFVEDRRDPTRPAVPSETVIALLKEACDQAWEGRFAQCRPGLPVTGPNATVVGYHVAPSATDLSQPPNTEPHQAEHPLKIWPPHFQAVRAGRKTLELRLEDTRTFATGDTHGG